MFYPFRIGIGSLGCHAERQQKVDDKVVPASGRFRKLGTFGGKEDAAVRLSRNPPLALEPLDCLRNGDVADPKPLRKVDRSRLSGRPDQRVDHLDVIFSKFPAVILPRPLESVRAHALGRIMAEAFTRTMRP
jgi:hypothetical protein